MSYKKKNFFQFIKVIVGWIFLHIVVLSFAQQQYLKAEFGDKDNLSNRMVVLPESKLEWAKLHPPELTFSEIGVEEDGYFEFTFSKLDATDNVSFILEDENGDVSFEIAFHNNQPTWKDMEGNKFSLPPKNYNNILFRLEKCGQQIILYLGRDIPIWVETYDISVPLEAKVKLNAPSSTNLDMVFEVGDVSCNLAVNRNAPILLPGDIMFIGYHRSGFITEFSLYTFVPIKKGTSFQLFNGTYDIEADHYQATPSNQGDIAIQEITYNGDQPIEKNSYICFRLFRSDFEEFQLAHNFSVNGNDPPPTATGSPGFNVRNVSNTVRPIIHLDPSRSSAVFLAQGSWKFSSEQAELFGTIISGLQYGGNWVNDDQAPSNGLSNIPPDIRCLYIEDGGLSSYNHAYFASFELTHTNITNFSNYWTRGFGPLPNGACSLFINTLQPSASSRTTSISSTNTVVIYPNPFRNDLTVHLNLEEQQPIQLELWNSLGQVVKSEPKQIGLKGEQQIPLVYDNLVDGLYWLKMKIGKEEFMELIIKQ